MASNPHDRLISTIGMMDATAGDLDGEGVNAFRAASRMLAAQGLTWRQIATMALDRPSLRPLGQEGVARAQGFGDVFDQMFGETFGASGFGRPRSEGRSAFDTRPSGFEAPKPKAPPRMHGVDVPDTVKGIVRVVDADRQARTGAMLVLEIVGDETIYGPLVCFSQAIIDELKASVTDGRQVIARIQKPRSDGHNPVVVAANVTGD